MPRKQLKTSSNGFSEYKKLLLDAIQNLRDDIHDLRQEVKELGTELHNVRLKAELNKNKLAIWGTIIGVTITFASILIQVGVKLWL